MHLLNEHGETSNHTRNTTPNLLSATNRLGCGININPEIIKKSQSDVDDRRNNSDNRSNNSTASSIASSSDSGVVLHETVDNGPTETTTIAAPATKTQIMNDHNNSKISNSRRNFAHSEIDGHDSDDGVCIDLRHIREDNTNTHKNANGPIILPTTTTTTTTATSTTITSTAKETEIMSAESPAAVGKQEQKLLLSPALLSSIDACVSHSTDSQEAALRIPISINDNGMASKVDEQPTELSIEALNQRATTTILEPQQSKQSIAKSNERQDSRKRVSPTTLTRLGHHNSSPSISIRSTTISIVSIGENDIESSVVDSDSEFVDTDADDGNDDDDDDDGEAAVTAAAKRGAYVVKRLGQQITYPPNSTNIPENAIVNGRTVLGQSITPHGLNHGQLQNQRSLEGVLATGLASIIPVPQSSAPQIGSIALTNSSDVTFGDKHFYEGPVTIHQFLINEKAKNGATDGQEGEDNPSYVGSGEGLGKGTGQANAGEDDQRSLKYIYRRKVFLIIGLITAVLVGVIIVLATSFTKASSKSKPLGDGDDYRKNIPINSTIGDADINNADVCPYGEFCVVDRVDWQAREPKSSNLTKLNLPVHRVIIAHTATEPCFTKERCISRVQSVQDYHMDSFLWDDIGYNHLVGGDGRVYVGRGFTNQGAHTKGYNVDSFGIAFIGTFTVTEPSDKQLSAAKELIEQAVIQHKLVPEYRLYGARQFFATESPGNALYDIIKTWAKWSSS